MIKIKDVSMEYPKCPPVAMRLIIKRNWLDMIMTGQKKEEYREIKYYWATRLLSSKSDMEPGVIDEMIQDMQQPFDRHLCPRELMDYFGVKFKPFDTVIFRNGYAKDALVVTIPISSIEIATGSPEWGAEEGKYYFVIKLGGKS